MNTPYVNLVVYDVLGRTVEHLVDGYQPAGLHNVTFNASKHASGIYIYRLTAGEFVESKRMLLIK